MAKSIILSSGSLLCGSPIVLDITPNTVNSRATFHRLKLEVSVALSTDASFEVYKQSEKVQNNQPIHMDISSILRSAASKYVYEYQTADRTYPYLIYTLKAYDEYMIDGILYEKEGEMDYGARLYAFMGKFTEVERYLSNQTKEVRCFSRKPSSGEVCVSDELFLYPTPLVQPLSMGAILSAGPVVKARSLSGLSGMQTFDGHSVYVIPPSANRIQFQFVNKLGIVESISAETREALSYETTTETDVVSVPGSFRPNRRILSRKGNKQQIYAMSSGIVNLDWADWWINEFLDCSQAWIKLNGNWFPCEVQPEDSISVYDKANNSMCEILFQVKLSLSGGYRNLI